jgi:hypothetical protein
MLRRIFWKKMMMKASYLERLFDIIQSFTIVRHFTADIEIHFDNILKAALHQLPSKEFYHCGVIS